jgi:hypothetical protein
MAKMQRVYKTGSDYYVEGTSGRTRLVALHWDRKNQWQGTPHLPAGKEGVEAEEEI